MILNGEQTLLVNIYGPNRDNELVAFYLSLSQTIPLIGGDFNCPLNPTVDKRGGNLFPRQSVINTIEELQSELNELRQSGEGAISLEECTEVLNSFPPNKVPGNDELPVEFYKIFWASIGNRLVECFNVSFTELSSSQKQAVITLIEKKGPRSLRPKKLEADFSFKC